MLKNILLFLQLILLTEVAYCQGIPDILYYKFDGTGMKVPNYASNPPAGADTAIITGNMTQGNFGTCQSGGIRGTGALLNSGDYMNTKWTCNLSGSWTISIWTDSVTPNTTFNWSYFFGDSQIGNLRCISSKINPGIMSLSLPTPYRSIDIPSAKITPTVSTFVYDSTTSELTGYIDGQFYSSVYQSTPVVLTSTYPFLIGAAASGNCINDGVKIDEFRFYSRALSSKEVSYLRYGSDNIKTIDSTHCDSIYKSPSGKYVWNKSGTYLDTFLGKYYCDQYLTINLTIAEHKYSSLNYIVCDSFALPSGQFGPKISGIYYDQLKLPNGCDSFMKINLTVLNSTKSSQKIKTCLPFHSPSGKFIWIESGFHNDTLKNNIGCDSIITFELEAGHISDTLIEIKACDFMISPSKKYKWESSGLYYDTIANFTGCDSLISINLTISRNTIYYDTISVCVKYVTSNNLYAWGESGDYIYVIPNSKGCDSTIYLHLTILKPTKVTISITACKSYTSPSGKYIWSVFGKYYDTIPNANGCDSCLTVNFDILPVRNGNLKVSSCNKYSSPSGKFIWKNDGVYTDTLTSYLGCDSVVYINLTIVPVNISVSRHLDVLTSDVSGAQYQWLDCNKNYAAINGENNQTFNVKTNGIYAVQVVENSCKDTSICINISNVGIKNSQSTNSFSLYPNPTFDKLKIQAKDAFINPSIKIYNLAGIEKQPITTINNTSIEIDIHSFLNGVYFLELTDGEKQIRYKIVKM